MKKSEDIVGKFQKPSTSNFRGVHWAFKEGGGDGSSTPMSSFNESRKIIHLGNQV